MKRLFVAAILWQAIGAATALAQTYSPATPTVDQFVDSMTVVGIRISSGSTAMEVTQYERTADMKWRSLSVQSLDNTNKIYCGESAATCTTESSDCAGQVIGPGNPGQTAVFTLNPGQRFYCLCNGSAPCNAVLGRGR